MTLASNVFAAPDLLNIKACLDAAKNFAGVELNSVPVNYDNNFIADDVASWANATCKVSSEDVSELIIDDTFVIFKEFAGENAYELFQKISDASKRSKKLLKERLYKNKEVDELLDKMKKLEDQKERVDDRKWDAERKVEKSIIASSKDKDFINKSQSNIYNIEDQTSEIRYQFEDLEVVKKYNHRIDLLDKIQDKSKEHLKRPNPKIDKISKFAKAGINKILKIDQNDSTNYFDNFYTIPDIGDDLKDLEIELNNL